MDIATEWPRIAKSNFLCIVVMTRGAEESLQPQAGRTCCQHVVVFSENLACMLNRKTAKIEFFVVVGYEGEDTMGRV